MNVIRLAVLALLLSSVTFTADNGTVTIYRTHDMNWGIPETVNVDGAKLADFEPDTWITVSLSPGRHSVDWDGYAQRTTPLVLDVKSGTLQYVRVHMKYSGLSSHVCCIVEMPPDRALAEMQKTHPLPEKRIKAINLVAPSQTQP